MSSLLMTPLPFNFKRVQSPTSKNYLTSLSSIENKTKDYCSPMNKQRNIENLVSTKKEIDNSLPEISSKKHINYSRFVLTPKMGEGKRFHSPPLSPKGDSKTNFCIISEKYKEIKTNCQESEIKIFQLYNELNLVDPREKSKQASLCLEIINSVFINNAETTNQFKKVSPIIEKLLFCPKSLEEELSHILNEKIAEETDKTYAEIVQILMRKIADGHKSNLKKIISKNQEIEKLSSRNQQIQLENNELQSKLWNSEEKVQVLTNLQKDLQSGQKEKMELSINLFFKENLSLKQEIQNNIRLYEQEKEAMSKEFTDKIAEIKQEKEFLGESNAKIENELKTAKSMFQKSAINHQTLCFFLKKLKSKVEINEQEISRLIIENQNLKVRAGVAFDELTPRPSFDNVKQIVGFEKFNLKGKSTKTIVNELLEAFTKFITKFHRRNTFQPIPEENRRLRNSHSYNSEDKKGTDGLKWSKLKDLIIIKK